MKTVGIIGRTNVGKSTLFNRLIKQKKSIVSSIAGTTRDFLEGEFELNGENVRIIDFGGWDFLDSEIDKKIKETILKNIKKLDLILFVVDGKNNITIQDERIAELIRKSKKETVLVVNKIDNYKKPESIYDFYQLGFSDMVGVSAINDVNIDKLIEEIGFHLNIKKTKRVIRKKEITKITIIGRPNVGKSTIFNELYGEERNIVSDIPGTTRDAIDAEIKLREKKYLFVDTAGLRRKAKINELLDKESSYKSINAINKSDIVLYILDVNSYATDYDIKLLIYAWRKGKSIIVAVNKWDIKPHDMTEKRFFEILCNDYSFFRKLPFVFISAVKGSGFDNLIDQIQKTEKESGLKIKTSVLNRELKKIITQYSSAGAKFFYATQVNERPIEFLLFVNKKRFFSSKYLEYVEKKIREVFSLSGIPLFIKIRERERN